MPINLLPSVTLMLLLVLPRLCAAQERGHLDVSWQMQEPALSLHEPVVVVLTVRNRSGESAGFDLGRNGKENLQFTIRTARGELMKVARVRVEEGIAFPGEVALAPAGVYSREIVLNEWYTFESPGRYLVDGQLLAITNEAGRMELEILPRDAARLRAVCERLAGRAINTHVYDSASEAAQALSYVNDPVAIPFLKKVLEESFHGKKHAIEGLERIATSAAVDVLVKELKTGDETVRAQIIGALYDIERHSQDKELKEQIKNAIRPFVSAEAPW